ncbi:MAG: preprotein translocase subunit SecE [Fimbriimonadales bacterium]
MDAQSKTPTTGSLPTPKMKRGLKGFFAEVTREMKKVTWPPYKEINRLTGIVLAVCGLVVLTLTIMHLVADTAVHTITKGF